jgi:hypothetical protein
VAPDSVDSDGYGSGGSGGFRRGPANGWDEMAAMGHGRWRPNWRSNEWRQRVEKGEEERAEISARQQPDAVYRSPSVRRVGPVVLSSTCGTERGP